MRGPWSSSATADSSATTDPSVSVTFDGLGVPTDLAARPNRYFLSVWVRFGDHAGGARVIQTVGIDPAVDGDSVAAAAMDEWLIHAECAPSDGHTTECVGATEVTCAIDASGVLRLRTDATGSLSVHPFAGGSYTMLVWYTLVARPTDACYQPPDDRPMLVCCYSSDDDDTVSCVLWV